MTGLGSGRRFRPRRDPVSAPDAEEARGSQSRRPPCPPACATGPVSVPSLPRASCLRRPQQRYGPRFHHRNHTIPVSGRAPRLGRIAISLMATAFRPSTWHWCAATRCSLGRIVKSSLGTTGVRWPNTKSRVECGAGGHSPTTPRWRTRTWPTSRFQPRLPMIYIVVDIQHYQMVICSSCLEPNGGRRARTRVPGSTPWTEHG